MDVLADVRIGLHDVQHGVRKIFGMGRREANAHVGRSFCDALQQLVESSATLFGFVDGSETGHKAGGDGVGFVGSQIAVAVDVLAYGQGESYFNVSK